MSVLNRTGLNDDECKEVHTIMSRGLFYYVGLSFVIHLLVAAWMPWFPSAG